jgi:hypothetical protein
MWTVSTVRRTRGDSRNVRVGLRRAFMTRPTVSTDRGGVVGRGGERRLVYEAESGVWLVRANEPMFVIADESDDSQLPPLGGSCETVIERQDRLGLGIVSGEQQAAVGHPQCGLGP